MIIGTDNDNNKNKNESSASVARAGYNIIYVALVIFTVIFCFTYLKRVIYLAFLTIIAPLVAITYPIDKMNDGQAQAFNMWLKEYIFNLLIQPMHLILYTVLVGSAMKFAATNIFYVVVALGFLVPAEKLLRRFFGFEKSQTAGVFSGAAGAAVMMTGLNKLLHHRPSLGKGSGGKNNSLGESNNKIKTPAMNRKMNNTEGLFESDNSRTRISDAMDGSKGAILGAGLGSLAASGSKLGTRTSGKKLSGPIKYKGSTSNKKKISKPKNSNKKVSQPKRNQIKAPKSNSTDMRKFKQPKKRSKRRALAAGLRARGRKINKYYGLSGSQTAIRLAKKGLGTGAKVGGAVLGASAAGLASIAGGDPQQAIQNMAIAGASGYAAGKGISNKIENASMKEEIDAAKEGYYGKDYEKIQQKKYEKQFARDEENLKKIQKKMNVERDDAKIIAKEVAKNTEINGIDNIDQALAMYQMKQDGKYSDQEIGYAASYNEMVLGGKNTRHMEDRRKHQRALRDSLMNSGETRENAEKKAKKIFDAMDKYNEFK